MPPVTVEDLSPSSPDASVLLLMEDNGPRMLSSDDREEDQTAEVILETSENTNNEMVRMPQEESAIKIPTPTEVTEATNSLLPAEAPKEDSSATQVTTDTSDETSGK